MKAIIQISGQQYIVSKGDELLIDRQESDKTLTLEPLAVFDEKKTHLGQPVVKGAKVSAEVIDNEVKGDKVKIVKFQAKKRVHKTTGHRQPQTRIKIKSISVK